MYGLTPAEGLTLHKGEGTGQGDLSNVVSCRVSRARLPREKIWPLTIADSCHHVFVGCELFAKLYELGKCIEAFHLVHIFNFLIFYV